MKAVHWSCIHWMRYHNIILLITILSWLNVVWRFERVCCLKSIHWVCNTMMMWNRSSTTRNTHHSRINLFEDILIFRYIVIQIEGALQRLISLFECLQFESNICYRMCLFYEMDILVLMNLFQKHLCCGLYLFGLNYRRYLCYKCMHV